MKKVIYLLIIGLIIPFTFADDTDVDNFSDPELLQSLDGCLPSLTEGTVIIGRFNGSYGRSGGEFKRMLGSVMAGSRADSRNRDGYAEGADSGALAHLSKEEVIEELNRQAQEMFEAVFGDATPSRNWAVIIDIGTQSIKQVCHARDFVDTTTDMDGNDFTYDRDGERVKDENDEYEYTAYRGTNAYTDGSAKGGYHRLNPMAGHTLNYKYKDKDGNVVTENYKISAAVNWSPIIIDLNFDQKPDTNRYEWTPHAPKFYRERTAIFDMSGDGKPDYIEWVGPNDGLLVLPEPDGTVKGACNLFGTAGGYKDGYEKMQITLDLDKNGWVEKDELNGLYIWRDRNGNAKVDSGEMVPIKKVGVTRIKVTHENFKSICYMGKKKVTTWDWWPAGYELMKMKKKK